VAGSCEYGDGPLGSDTTELVSYLTIISIVIIMVILSQTFSSI
jgi:hypothetical protein